MIFIAGPHNVGKTSLAKGLISFGFVHIETGDVVRMIHQKSYPDIDFHQWACEQEHQFDDFIAAEVLKAREKILGSADSLQDVIVTGNRQMRGILSILEKVLPIRGKGNIIIFLDADDQVLFERQVAREDRLVSGLTFKRFVEDFLNYDRVMGIDEIKERADVVINANGSKKDVLESVRRVLEKRGCEVGIQKEGIRTNLERVSHTKKENEV